VLWLGLAMIGWRADAVLAGVSDIPIVQDTRIDSLYTTDNYFGQNIKLIANAVSHDSGSVVRGLIALPQLPSLSASDVYSAKIWMCQTYYYGPSNENPYTRGATLYPLTQSYNLSTVTWQSCHGGQYDSSNPVPWNPAPNMAQPVPGFYNNGYWWCNWDFTSLWNNSNLLNNGAILMLDPETPPSTDWVTKYFAGSSYSLGQYQPFVEVVQMDQWNDVSGNWSTTTNWNTGTPSNVMDAVAGFLGNATQNRTVTVDSPVTVGTIILDNAAHSFTLVGSSTNSITMSSLSGESAITVEHGTHVISAPIVLASNTTVTVANATDTLTLSGDISDLSVINGVNTGLTLEGSGALILGGDNSYTGGTTVNSGRLYATTADALPDGTSVTVGAGGTLVLGSSVTPSVDMTATPMPEPGAPALLIAAMAILLLAAIAGRLRAQDAMPGGGSGPVMSYLPWRSERAMSAAAASSDRT